MNRIMALDVGGTFVKHAVFEDGVLLESSLGQFPVNEKGDEREILEPVLEYLDKTGARASAVSIPGPMDYATGTSRMKHKFLSLYGISMKEYFEKNIPGLSIRFVHDGAAFLMGVMRLGETKGAGKPCGVMLGTGLGFVMAEEDRVLLNAADTPFMPLWNSPFRDGIAEDYLSGRAMRAAYEKAAGRRADVKEMADLARNGDAAALQVFTDAGSALGEMMEARRRTAGIDRVILGGQISKAADLILPAAHEKTQVDIRPTAWPDSAALYGAAAYSEKGDALIRKITA